ncbi:cytochrome c biogenesis FC [Tanacetum coccineum]
MGSGLLPENALPLGSFIVEAQNLPCSFLGVRFLRTNENNLKLEGPGTSGSGSQNKARALEVTVAGIIFSLELTESISSKGMTSALIWQVSSGSSESGNATSLPALESSSSSESLATRDYYNLPPQNNPGEYEGLVRDHLDQALNVPHYRNILDMEYFELTVLERKGLLQDRLFNLMLGEQNLSRIMELSPYTNIRREAYDFLEAPVLLKWFVSRDVPTGAPSSNGTIIPIPIPSFPLLVYLHSRKFIRSTDGAKSGVLVRASRPILLPDIIGRSSSETRARKALFRFVPVLHFLLIEKKGDFSYLESFCGVLRLLFFRTFFSLPRDRSAKRERARRRKGQPNGNEQGRNDKMRCPGHPHLERRVEVFGPVALPVPPSSGGACVGGAPAEIGLEALTLPTSRQLMAVGHDYYKKAPMKMNISHGGVCIFMLGVLLSCDPAAYVRPVAHASYLFRAGGVNSDSIRVTPVGEVALSIPSGQPGREHGGDGLPKKPARAGKKRESLSGRFFGRDKLVKKEAYPRPDCQLLALSISPKLPPGFGPSCMRQKLVPRTVRRPSPTPAVRVRLRLTNTKKIQFTQRLPLGSELHMGKERCCLQGIDYLHGPTSHSICGNFLIYKPSLTNDRLMFEDDESLRVDLLPINFPASYENGKLEHFLHRWMKNREHKNFWLTMFPEKRYFQETTNTTEVAIHTNPFTDLYAPIGTSSSRTGGWYTTIMKLPFIFFIRIGFMLASLGGSRSLLRQLQKDKLPWNRESYVEFIIA